MAFVDDLILAFTDERIKQWSNAGNNTNATIIDQPVIDHFEAQLQGEFIIYVGTPFDVTNNIHLAVGMRRAGFLLRRFAGDIGQQTGEDEKSLEAMERARSVTHSDTVTPEKQAVNKIPLEDLNESAFDTFTLFRNGFPPIRRNPPISSRNFMDNF